MATASEDPNLTIRASACSEFEAEFHACEAGIWRRRAATSDEFPKPPGARFVRMEDWNPWAARPKKAEKKSPWAAECFFGGRLPSAHGRVAEVTPSIFSSHLHRHSPTRQRAVLTSGRAKHHQSARSGQRPKNHQHRTVALWLACDCSDVHRRFLTRSLLGCPSARPSDRPKSLQCASNFSQEPVQKAFDPRLAQARTANCSLVAPHPPNEQLIV